MTDPNNPNLPVTQADRDAAADLIDSYWPNDQRMRRLAADYRAGHTSGVWAHAFACHRQRSSPSGSDPGEGVAEITREEQITLTRLQAVISASCLPATASAHQRDLRDVLALVSRLRALSAPSSTLTPDAEPVAWLRQVVDDDGVAFVVTCAEGDVGSFPAYAAPSATPAIRDQAFEEALGGYANLEDFASVLDMTAAGLVAEGAQTMGEEIARAAKIIRTLKGAHPSPAGDWVSGTYADKSGTLAEPSPDLLKGLVEALEPFAAWAADNTDGEGWAGSRCERERIVDWFGPSDFRRAVEAAALLKAQQPARERDGHTLPPTNPPDFEYPGPHDDLGPVIGRRDQ